jgi:hypothetical protein
MIMEIFNFKVISKIVNSFMRRHWILINVCLIFPIGILSAQDISKMSKDERTAYFENVAQGSAEDHKKMMEQLGIDSLRPGADGMDPKAVNAANYDEAKANPFPALPDPLRLDNGKTVTDRKTWWSIKRPGIIKILDDQIFGAPPGITPEVTWKELTSYAESQYGIPVHLRKLAGEVDNSGYPQLKVVIDLTVVTPKNRKGPVPIVMQLSFNFPPGFFPAEPGPDWKEQVLSRGWGYAELVPVSFQADHGLGLAEGVIGLMNKGQLRKPNEWGTLRAWAWGASKTLDFFLNDPHIDGKKVAIAGHSRYGKAAAVVMAYDQRFAIAYVSSSGEGGLKLHRRNYGEIVENLAASGEYHWMAGNFLRYAGPLTWDDLPIDAHHILALCAPRPVFIGCGTKGDQWVDPKGMFLAAVAAGPVYKLLGGNDLGSTDFPPVDSALVTGEIAFRQHNGGHTPGPNWKYFLDYAEKYFK